MPNVLPSVHRSPETAYLIESYPFGRTRCYRRIWIETKMTKAGVIKGQRFMAQTTKKSVNWIEGDEHGPAPMDKPHLWNKPKASTYNELSILAINPETGHYAHYGVPQYGWLGHYANFARKFGKDLDIFQLSRFGSSPSAAIIAQIRQQWKDKQKAENNTMPPTAQEISEMPFFHQACKALGVEATKRQARKAKQGVGVWQNSQLTAALNNVKTAA